MSPSDEIKAPNDFLRVESGKEVYYKSETDKKGEKKPKPCSPMQHDDSFCAQNLFPDRGTADSLKRYVKRETI